MLLRRQYSCRVCLRGVEANSDKAPLCAAACSSAMSHCSGTCCSKPPPPLSSFDADAAVCSQLCVCLCVECHMEERKKPSALTRRLLSYSHKSRREICARGGQCRTSEDILYHGYNLYIYLYLYLYLHIALLYRSPTPRALRTVAGLLPLKCL